MGARAGLKIPGFRLHRRQAVTDFSEIWLAEDLALERPVAIKVFAPRPGPDGTLPPFSIPEWLRRFEQEARILASFDHPHLLPVVAMGYLEDQRPYMVMQYMWGSLEAIIGTDEFRPEVQAALTEKTRPKAMAPAQARRVLLEVLSALTVLHERGIVHRDIKPRNILFSGGPGGRVKLADLGMARHPDDQVSERRVWFGTRDYIAPEQFAEADKATDRADVFSLGVVGIRMLTGHFPDRDRLAAVKGLSPEFIALLVEALSLEPEKRPSARTMAQRLAGL